MGGAHIDSINEFVFVHVGGWVWVRIMFRCCHLEMFHLCVCPCFDGLIILSQQFPKSAPPESSNQHFGAQTVHTRGGGRARSLYATPPSPPPPPPGFER